MTLFYWVIAITSSQTYNWAPQIGDLILSAFSRINIRGPELTPQHLQDAAAEANFLNVSFSNRAPLQWQLQTPTITLVQGTPTYALPSNVVALGLVYLTTNAGSSSAFDRPLSPMSAADYAAIPNKTIQGPPTTHWLNMAVPTPELTVWPVPDGNGPYILNCQSYRQLQDLSVQGGQTIDAPYRFYEAWVAGLAARLARNWAPALYQLRKADYEETFSEAASRDQEDSALFLSVGLSSYFN